MGGGKGWLERLGFIDYAGATVVHSIGGWAALAVLLLLGPRHGRFAQEKQTMELGASNIPLGVMGGLVLWLGWFGFNGGSAYAFNSNVAQILAVTNIAGIFAIISAFATAKFLFKRNDPRDLVSGGLAGLVAITACANSVSVRSSAFIGAIAGILVMLGKALLEKRKIDDAVDAVPVHLIAGIWGTLCVALFGEKELIGTGLAFTEQLSIQAFGILIAAVWGFGIPYFVFALINRFFAFRISLKEEIQGLNISEHRVSTELYDFYRTLSQNILEGNVAEQKDDISYTEFGKLAQTYHEKTKALLANFLSLSSQGFFSFGSAMQIELGYSQECHKILAQESLEGKKVSDVIFPPGLKRKEFQDAFALYFEGKVDIEIIAKLLDSKIFIYDSFGQVKDIRIEYQEIEGKRIMCILTDESEKKELAQLLSSEQEEKDRLLKSVANSKYFKHTLAEASELFALFTEFRQLKKTQKQNLHAWKSLFLAVHNFKANLSFFEFDKTTPFVFELETFLGSLSSEADVDIEIFTKHAQKIEEAYTEDLRFFKERLGEDWLESFDTLSVSMAEALEIADSLKDKYPDDTELIDKVESIRKVPAKSIFSRMPELAEQLAEKLGKKINPVSIDGGETRVLIDIFEPLSKVLVHIIRNMLDHGIESPDERLAKGKEEAGNIRIRVREVMKHGQDYYLIQFSDDGRGIDFEKLSQVAYANALLAKGQQASSKQLLELLFSAQVSAKADELSDISGRGVGLASLAKEVRALKGKIGVQTRKGQGATFSIRIPQKSAR